MTALRTASKSVAGHSVAPVVPLEQAAIRRCKEGEIEGLASLYGIYSERVFRTCFRILGDRATAEEQTHEVFLRVFEQILRFDGRSRFSTWLFRLTVNHTLNRLRRRKHRSLKLQTPLAAAEVAPSERPDARLLRQEAADRVQALLNDLSLEHRTVLVLREIEELRYAEIAEVLGIAEGTVMSRLHRARRELRRRWLLESGRNSDRGGNVQKSGRDA